MVRKPNVSIWEGEDEIKPLFSHDVKASRPWEIEQLRYQSCWNSLDIVSIKQRLTLRSGPYINLHQEEAGQRVQVCVRCWNSTLGRSYLPCRAFYRRTDLLPCCCDGTSVTGHKAASVPVSTDQEIVLSSSLQGPETESLVPTAVCLLTNSWTSGEPFNTQPVHVALTVFS